ncbi:MAG: hypothetical protein NWR54_08100 [Paracoccaceae bacterium]|nr:hypothetical protein [Paracoccaceae bacterium]
MNDTIKNMRPWQRREREQQIRDIALEQLTKPRAGFDPYVYIDELEQLSPARRRTVENLEATIMLCMGARMRPTRTRQSLRFLRDKRAENGELHLFDAFETFLKDAIGTDVLLAHGFAPKAFGSMDHDAIWNDLRGTVARLNDLGPGVFLNSGTLLGVTRDKALIAHDDDIDLAFVMKAQDATAAAREWIALRGTLVGMGLFSQEHYNPKDIAILKVKSAGDYMVDLFPAWIEGGRVFVYPHTYGELDVAQVLPTRPCAVTGLPVPAAPEAMLALNYGPGWQVSDPYFKFPWAQAKRNFAAFLDAVEREARQA